MDTLFSYDDDEIRFYHNISYDPKSEDYPMHAHNSLEIYYFISGNCRYLVEGNEYSLKHGDIMIMRPSETHNLLVLGNEPYERVTVNISAGFIRSFDNGEALLKPFFDRSLGRLNRYRKEEFSDDIRKICFEDVGEDSFVPKKIEVVAKTFTALCEICKCFEAKRDGEVDDAGSGDISSRLIGYINSNLFEPISLLGISEEFYLSSSQLNRIFRRATGSSVWEYVTIKRLIAARNMIRSGDSAGKACAECGFKDYSSFYRLYKSRFGVSPKQDA